MDAVRLALIRERWELVLDIISKGHKYESTEEGAAARDRVIAIERELTEMGAIVGLDVPYDGVEDLRAACFVILKMRGIPIKKSKPALDKGPL